MKVFVDANVLISVLNKEYPVFTYSSRVLSLADSGKFKLYTTPLCLAISFYFSAKKSGEKQAKKKIGILMQKLSTLTIDKNAVDKALENPQIKDLEDGFQYYAALKEGCECIITEDENDFYFSKISVLKSEGFLESYVF
ncbi:MAG: PIN domain-containing protein [Cyclobacteriaceae bacterium]